MVLGCKKGCLCGDINKDYCCLECSNCNTCKEPCMSLMDEETNKEKVLKFCQYSIRINS